MRESVGVGVNIPVAIVQQLKAALRLPEHLVSFKLEVPNGSIATVTATFELTQTELNTAMDEIAQLTQTYKLVPIESEDGTT